MDSEEVSVGKCGATSPGANRRPDYCGLSTSCDLPAGHAGWHSCEVSRSQWGRLWVDEPEALGVIRRLVELDDYFGRVETADDRLVASWNEEIEKARTLVAESDGRWNQ